MKRDELAIKIIINLGYFQHQICKIILYLGLGIIIKLIKIKRKHNKLILIILNQKSSDQKYLNFFRTLSRTLNRNSVLRFSIPILVKHSIAFPVKVCIFDEN